MLEQLNLVKNKVNNIIQKKQLKTSPKIIVVTKTFPLNNIIPLLDSGHIHYGENKIQEAEDKWHEIKNSYKNLQLHMIGKLQTNKAKKAIKLFDYIHSLDSSKLALKLSQHEKELNKKVKFFIQVNLANESQKSGINIKELSKFYSYCVNELSLNIIGLMCIPPQNLDSVNYFNDLNNLAKTFNLSNLSMGMSHDYIEAINCGSTFVRIGEMIFGKRIIQ